MFLDKYLTRPYYYTLNLWLTVLFVTHARYWFTGFMSAWSTFPADRKGQYRCMTDPDHRTSFSKRCAELDSLNVFSPFWKGWEAVGDNTYLTLNGFSDWVGYSMKSFGLYVMLAGVLMFFIGLAMYSMLVKILQQASELSMKQHTPQPAFSMQNLPDIAWQQLAQISNTVTHSSPPSSMPPKKLRWITSRNKVNNDNDNDDNDNNEEINH